MSGFMKPVFISNSLCDFLGRDYGTKLSRVEVTKEICGYIKEKDLQDPLNRRIIIPDMRLATLLNYDEPLMYYGIQKKLQPHFLKPAAKAHSKKSRKNPKDYSDPNDYSDLK